MIFSVTASSVALSKIDRNYQSIKIEGVTMLSHVSPLCGFCQASVKSNHPGID